MRFPMSPRWTSYVVPKPPKGGSKTQGVQNLNNKLRWPWMDGLVSPQRLQSFRRTGRCYGIHASSVFHKASAHLGLATVVDYFRGKNVWLFGFFRQHCVLHLNLCEEQWTNSAFGYRRHILGLLICADSVHIPVCMIVLILTAWYFTNINY